MRFATLGRRLAVLGILLAAVPARAQHNHAVSIPAAFLDISVQ